MSSNTPDRPLIVQSDLTVLLETGLPESGAARDGLALFAELVKSPEHVHTWRLTPLSLWNAASAGIRAEEVLAVLTRHSRFDLPPSVVTEIGETMSRYGRLRLSPGEGGDLTLESDDPWLLTEVARSGAVQSLLGAPLGPGRMAVPVLHRGRLKSALIRLGWPVEDLAGYVEGEPLSLRLRDTTRSGIPVRLRPYQAEAVDAFHAGGSPRGGSGTIVLPCGSGKTMVGLGVMDRLQTSTLVLTTSITALRQWQQQMLEFTTLEPDQIGEYSGEAKQVAPVTLSTYQMLTHRRRRDAPFEHFDLFRRRGWGLIIYDEVHLLPAPVFRVVAEIQARRRLGLTATLVREDGREEDVFCLIGPMKYDVPWHELEGKGFIAAAACVEVRVPMAAPLRRRYAAADDRARFRLAATNPSKEGVVEQLLSRHPGEPVLIIGQYLVQLRDLGRRLGAPILTGETPQAERESLYARFRSGEIPVLVVSKVANFAVDLPDASLAVQISGTFGSRQEEAQRLGRILRPKPGRNTAHFYTVVSSESVEGEYARRRQIFLIEQGYRYRVESVQAPA